MSDPTNADLIARVRGYLEFRDSVMPHLDGVYTSVIHDIDAGSQGHFSLHDTDIAELLTALERAGKELAEARLLARGTIRTLTKERQKLAEQAATIGRVRDWNRLTNGRPRYRDLDRITAGTTTPTTDAAPMPRVVGLTDDQWARIVQRSGGNTTEALADFIEATSTRWEADFVVGMRLGPKADYLANTIAAHFSVTPTTDAVNAIKADAWDEAAALVREPIARDILGGLNPYTTDAVKLDHESCRREAQSHQVTIAQLNQLQRMGEDVLDMLDSDFINIVSVTNRVRKGLSTPTTDAVKLDPEVDPLYGDKPWLPEKGEN